MKLRNILISIFALILVLTLVSCNNSNPPHEHNFVNGECSCGESDPNFIPPHEHNFVNGVCSCGEKETSSNHNFENGICHIFRIGAFLATVQVLDERKNLSLHEVVHLLSR